MKIRTNPTLAALAAALALALPAGALAQPAAEAKAAKPAAAAPKAAAAVVQPFERGSDLGQQAGQVAELGVVHRALDGAALGVAQRHDQARAGQLGGEFQAAPDVVVDEVAAHRHAA